MRILFLGAGATGGYFGGRLMETGADVTFLVRPKRQAQLREEGLVVVSPFGALRLPVPTLTKARPGFDLIVITCKAFDLDSAIETIRPAVGLSTLVMPLLNGLRQFEVLDGEFGVERVPGGLCHIPITMDPDGTIRHLNPIHRIRLGARSSGQERAIETLATAFAKTPVDCRTSSDIMRDLWEKFVFLATLAGSTCLMRAPVGSIVGQPGGAAFMQGLYDECRATAAAEGYPPRPEADTDSLGQLVDPQGHMTASMARDIARGNRTEAEHILGDMGRRAAEHGIPTPLLSLALLHLRSYEAERAKKAG